MLSLIEVGVAVLSAGCVAAALGFILSCRWSVGLLGRMNEEGEEEEGEEKEREEEVAERSCELESVTFRLAPPNRSSVTLCRLRDVPSAAMGRTAVARK